MPTQPATAATATLGWCAEYFSSTETEPSAIGGQLGKPPDDKLSTGIPSLSLATACAASSKLAQLNINTDIECLPFVGVMRRPACRLRRPTLAESPGCALPGSSDAPRYHGLQTAA